MSVYWIQENHTQYSNIPIFQYKFRLLICITTIQIFDRTRPYMDPAACPNPGEKKGVQVRLATYLEQNSSQNRKIFLGWWTDKTYGDQRTKKETILEMITQNHKTRLLEHHILERKTPRNTAGNRYIK